MSKVVLHIGGHKTATTTIQDMFHGNADTLAEHGVIYPRFDRQTGHHGLVINWAKMPKMFRLPDGDIGTLTALAERYGPGDQTLFLSSEEFSRDRCLVDIAKIREVLAPFDEIEVICVLRSQWQFLQSAYVEVSRGRCPPRPGKVVEQAIETSLYEGLWVDYNRLVERLEGVFAPEEITLFSFEECRNHPGGIVGRFLEHLGLDIDQSQLETVNEGNSNVSPMSLASYAANILAEPTPAPLWLIDKAAHGLRQEFGGVVKPCLFTRAEFATLKSHFDPLNAELALRPAAQRNGFSISPLEPRGVNLFREDISAAYWARMAKMGFEKMLRSRKS
ncbi:hypothetical protein ACFORG_01680 [Lutimaribacter marinistellae]|uniref:Sulfotransferase domain-containing protein n=1 Tax=Lutimaribacter marinistellae TaxID=1820329 RepID=A0ABV7TA65_9RHOB